MFQRQFSGGVAANAVNTRVMPQTSVQGQGHGARRGRIRVQAGDKGVSPAKSKNGKRRRAALSPVDQNALSMDAVVWSDDTYTVEQLVWAYGTRTPVIVKVTQGYYGAYGVELASNEVRGCITCLKQF